VVSGSVSYRMEIIRDITNARPTQREIARLTRL